MFAKQPQEPHHSDSWTGPHTGPRILVEDADGAKQWAMQQALLREGYDVAVCDGPDPAHRHDCPLVVEGHCTLADEADMIVCEIPLDKGAADIVAAIHEHEPSTPIARSGTIAQAERGTGDFDGVTRITFPTTVSAFVGTVERLTHADRDTGR